MKTSSSTQSPPEIAGLTWRPITRDDLAALVDLAEACRLVDGGIAFLNLPEHLEKRYFRSALGSAIGATDAGGRLAACATAHLVRDADSEWVQIAGQVRPDLRFKGIGSFLMRWSQAQAQALLSDSPADKRKMKIATESLTDAASHLYEEHGFELVFKELVMKRDLSAPLPDRPRPAEAAFASWRPELAQLFYEAYQTSFRDRPGFPGWTSAEWIRWTDDDNLRPEWSLLAQMDGRPLGFVTAGVEHRQAFIMQIGVIPDQRRRGLASALMVEAMGRMQAAGEIATELSVNCNNPGAIKLYERLGFFTAGRRARYERATS